MRSVTVVLSLMFLLLAVPATADVIRVPADQPTIQAGINAAVNGDEVVVANGIYTGPGNRGLDFDGKAITVRSAHGPAACIIAAGSSIYGEHHRGVWFHTGEDPDSVLEGFTIRGCIAEDGAAVCCELFASPTITGNIFIDNLAFTPGANSTGGGIYCLGTSPVITGNVFIENGAGGLTPDFCDGTGGAIGCINADPLIVNNLFAGNYATGMSGGDGGAIYCYRSSPRIESCTFAMNWAFGGDYDGVGGAIFCKVSCSPVIIDSVFWHDEAITGGNEIALQYDAVLDISWSILEGGQEAIRLMNGASVDWGTGMIDTDPLFVAGPLGDFYLSQTAAAQTEESPAVDAGNPDSAMITGTTRTDAVQDTGILDLGYHHPLTGGGDTPPNTTILSGPSGAEDSPVLTFTFTGTDWEDLPENLEYQYRIDDRDWYHYRSETWITIDYIANLPQGEHTFQVRARDSDGNVDPYPAERTFTWAPWEVPIHWMPMVTGPGPGRFNPALVRTPQAEWLAYSAGYGVNVACGDIDGDGTDEVLTGAGPGPPYGPHVRGWELDGSPLAGISYFAYGTHRFGVNVAAADLDGDGTDEILTGAGPGEVFGPHVRGWSWDGSSTPQPIPGISFIAYGTPKWGVNVAGGDVNGDGIDEIIAGAGPGAVYGPHVRGWRVEEGDILVQAAGLSFLAYGTPKYGVNVACGDIDGDGIDEIITGPGPGPMFSDHIRAFKYDGSGVEQVPGVSYLVSMGHFGAQISAADMDDDGIDEILAVSGAGLDEVAWITAWDADGGEVDYVGGSLQLAYSGWMTHGGRIAGIRNP